MAAFAAADTWRIVLVLLIQVFNTTLLPACHYLAQRVA
jgi:hypothetical protein